MSEKFVVGLDAGTSKVSVLVVRTGRGAREVVGYGIAPSEGIKKGVVTDMDAAVRSLKKAFSDAEASSGVSLRAAYASVSGSHVKCIRNTGATGVRSRFVTERDIKRAVDAASMVYLPLDREALHVFPAGYVLDGLDGIVRPPGMSGIRLEAKVHVVTASHTALENLRRCSAMAGVRIIDMVFGPVAAGRALLKPDEIRRGVALIDIGGGTADLAVYKDGLLMRAAVLPVGGNNITHDIAMGLGVTLKEAERLKREHGADNSTVEAGENSSTGEVAITGSDGMASTAPGARLSGIIRLRCEEIFELLREEIGETGVSFAVLTGGTAMLKGIKEIAGSLLGVPARVGAAEESRFRNPAYSTAVGLSRHAFGAERDSYEDIFVGVAERIKGLAIKGFGIGKG